MFTIVIKDKIYGTEKNQGEYNLAETAHEQMMKLRERFEGSTFWPDRIKRIG
jgi:sulfur relay (sulfurtransferase) complex TusBCD TusD component (DsrE family)